MIARIFLELLIPGRINKIRRSFFLICFITCQTLPGAGQTMSRLDSLIHWVDTHPKDDSEKIRKMHTISFMLSGSDVKKSFAYYERVSFLSDSLHFIFGKSLAQINLGILLSSAGNFESSTNAFFRAIDLADSCGATRLKAISLNNIGENFFSLADFDKARNYAGRAIGLNAGIHAWDGVAINYEFMHRCDFEQQRYADALKRLNEGMPYARMAEKNTIYSSYYLGYGKLKAVAGRQDSANYYFDLAIAAARKDRGLQDEYLVYLAEAKYLRNLPVRKRADLLFNALTMATANDFQEDRADAARQLSSVYDELKMKDSSLYFYRMYRTINDSIFSEKNRRNTIVNESEWLVKRKELENANLKQLAAMQEKQIASKNTLLLLAAIGFALTILVAMLIYKSIQSKKLKEELQYKQKIAETEMQALRAQMNPHFFFNSLNSIENFIMQNDKKQASDYLNKFARFIRSVLDSSYDELAEINKDVESLQLYIDLEMLRYNNKFRYCCRLDLRLSEGEYFVPSLLAQPFLENAIIHGIGPSDREDLKLCIKITLEEDRIHYTIEDNGIGRRQSAAYKDLNKPFHKSVGMKITQERINIFNQDPTATASVKITDLYDQQERPAGTRIEFSIKLVSYANAQSHIG
ncbi:MAG TPA: histidine kinase [Puia sp.]|nr:histidine kinase [Puia sp.]